MKHNISNIWIRTFEALVKNPIVLMPFVVIAFLECLALELAYFSTRAPLAVVLGPIIRKFFGEASLHYPTNLVILPNLFYFGQVAVYILASTFLAAIAVQIFVNIRTNHPVIAKAIIKSTAKRYAAFIGYALVYIILMFILEKAEGFVFLKTVRLISRHLFKISSGLYFTLSSLILFLTFIIVQTLLILTIPVMVTEKQKLFKSIVTSLSISARNFIKIVSLILLPFLFYLPIMLLKTFLNAVMDKTFPEISFYVLMLGIVASIFIDSFAMMSVTQFLLDTKKDK